VIATALYRDYPDHKESQLTLSKIYLVKEPTLADVARTIKLGEQMFL
jgi:dsRNA-specific ribonuclease